MSDNTEKVIGKDTVEERIRVAQSLVKDAEKIDDRWSWYVLTIPFAAIAFSLQVEVPSHIWIIIFHFSSICFLSIACIFGILSQRDKSKLLMFSSEEHIRLAQLIPVPTIEEKKRLLENFLEVNKAKKKSRQSMTYKQKTQYWTTGIGLFFLLLQHSYPLVGTLRVLVHKLYLT